MEIIFVCFITESDRSLECPSQGGEAAYPACFGLVLLDAWVSRPAYNYPRWAGIASPPVNFIPLDPVLVDPASLLDGFLQKELSDVPGFSALLWSALLTEDRRCGRSWALGTRVRVQLSSVLSLAVSFSPCSV